MDSHFPVGIALTDLMKTRNRCKSISVPGKWQWETSSYQSFDVILRGLRSQIKVLQEAQKAGIADRHSLKHFGTVQLTGIGGSPVYASGSIQDATTIYGQHKSIFFLSTPKDYDDIIFTCPISQVPHVEIRLSGIYVTNLNQFQSKNTYIDDNTVYVGYNFQGSKFGVEGWDSFRVLLHFGPRPSKKKHVTDPIRFRDDEIHRVTFGAFDWNSTTSQK